MTKLFKFIGYALVFIVSFIFFVYLYFPFDSVSDRILDTAEKQLGGAIEIKVGKLQPYYITGVEIDDLNLFSTTGKEKGHLLQLDNVKARAGLFSIIFSKPNLAFSLQAGDGGVDGEIDMNANGWYLDLTSNGFDVSTIKFLSSGLGLNLRSKIDGTVVIDFDNARPMRTKGEVDIKLNELVLKKSTVTIAGAPMEIPDLVLAKGKSRINVKVAKGVMDIVKFTIAGGALDLNLSGRIFLANTFDNYRLNLSGKAKLSPELESALPFLFIIEKQKSQDGSYELSITGRLSQPVIKIGTFTLPMG
ncbi:MAG: type II secretion system protein GspN [Pseudomonadota bacterium]